jgi:bacillithiol system protein YtxJ
MSSLNLIELRSIEDLQRLHEQSVAGKAEPLIIFKHSTRCGTSRIALKEFEKHWRSELPVYLILVVEQREISNVVESLYQIRHESPQLLVICNGRCILHESHYGIDADEVQKIIAAN